MDPDKINEDIVVPRSKIPDMIREIELLQAETGLTMVNFGHAGDGNIHVHIMLDKSIPEQVKVAEAAIEKVFDITLALGGTISGEHGVGVSKRPYISKEIGPVEQAIMKNIKRVFDPSGLLNPGKNFYIEEPFSKRSILFKFKEGKNFNHRHTLRIPRIKIFA